MSFLIYIFNLRNISLGLTVLYQPVWRGARDGTQLRVVSLPVCAQQLLLVERLTAGVTHPVQHMALLRVTPQCLHVEVGLVALVTRERVQAELEVPQRLRLPPLCPCTVTRQVLRVAAVFQHIFQLGVRFTAVYEGKRGGFVFSLGLGLS